MEKRFASRMLSHRPFRRVSSGGDGENLDQIVGRSGKKFLRQHRPEPAKSGIRVLTGAHPAAEKESADAPVRKDFVSASRQRQPALFEDDAVVQYRQGAPRVLLQIVADRKLGKQVAPGSVRGPRRTGVTATGRSRRTPSSRQGKQRQVGGNPNAGGGDGDGVGDLLANL